MSNLVTIIYYRSIKGQTIKYRMELDKDFLLIREAPANSPIWTPDKIGNDGMTDKQRAHAAWLDKSGYKYTFTNGHFDMTYIPPIEAKLHNFFSDQPCSFPGFDAWKEKYVTSRAKLVSDPHCTKCAENKFDHEFRELLKTYLAELESDSSA